MFNLVRGPLHKGTPCFILHQSGLEGPQRRGNMARWGVPGPPSHGARLRSDALQKLSSPPVSLFRSPVAVTGAFCNISHLKAWGSEKSVCARAAAKACQGDPARGRFLGVKARQICSLKKICFCRFSLSSKIEILVRLLATLMGWCPESQGFWVLFLTDYCVGQGGYHASSPTVRTSHTRYAWDQVKMPACSLSQPCCTGNNRSVGLQSLI